VSTVRERGAGFFEWVGGNMIKRYENLLIGDLTDERAMLEDADGSWVRYDDHEAEIAALCLARHLLRGVNKSLYHGDTLEIVMEYRIKVDI
jgi:hypothetical protein